MFYLSFDTEKNTIISFEYSGIKFVRILQKMSQKMFIKLKKIIFCMSFNPISNSLSFIVSSISPRLKVLNGESSLHTGADKRGANQAKEHPEAPRQNRHEPAHQQTKPGSQHASAASRSPALLDHRGRH